MVIWPDDAFVCFLHGLGSSAEEFRGHWGDLGEGAQRWFLDGPQLDRFSGGRRWFPLTALAPALAAGIERAADDVERELAHLDGVVLAGHSQGGMICLELLRRGRLRIRSAWSFAAFLPAPLREPAPRAPRDCELHLVWSRADQFADAAEVEATAELFRDVPTTTVHCHVSDTLSHGFTGAWLDGRNFAHHRR